MKEPLRHRGVWRVFVSALQSGSAIALTGVFLMLLAGGLTARKIIDTVANFHEDTLIADAQAVDIQIQLANVNYENTPQAQFKSTKVATGRLFSVSPKETGSAVTNGPTEEETLPEPSQEPGSSDAEPAEGDVPQEEVPVPPAPEGTIDNETPTEPASAESEEPPKSVDIDEALDILSNP